MEDLKRKEKMPLPAREMTMIALAAAVICVCAWITLPLGPVPFTLQTFALFFLTLFLGARITAYSLLLYLLLGLCGLPVFSGFRAGPAVLLGPTGGYLIGFFFVPLCSALMGKAFGKTKISEVFALLLGDVCVFAFGTLWFLLIYQGGSSAREVLALCVFPFILPDILKMVLAMILTHRISAFFKAA